VRLFHSLSIALFVIAATSCSKPLDSREYTLQGQILSVNAEHTEANIKHEDIKGFMPAMTMPYHVREAREFAELKPGDLITSTLVVVSNDAYLKNVKKVGDAPLEKAPEDIATAYPAVEQMKPGDQVSNATFVDQDGRRRDFASFRKSTALVTFIYTRCPMPTFCPLMDRHFAAIQKQIAADPALRDVRLVSVSFDPETDTPPVLKKHAQELGADPRIWTFLTGDRDEVDRFGRQFGVSIAREDNAARDITHNLRTVIVGGDGTLVKSYVGNEWTPEQVVADLKNVAGR
jgi:protein SCO1/2